MSPSAHGSRVPTARDAREVLVGGVNSPVRAFRQVGGEPLLASRARGARFTGRDGRTYLDFIMGWGALILGHNPPPIVRALASAAKRGMLFGLTHPEEVTLARRIIAHVPSVEQVRFTVSGTEACQTAVRLARAITKRPKILVFEGGYHGHGDSLMAGKTAGIPEAVAQATVMIPYNDPAALDLVERRFGSELACVIIEPVAANMGLILPEPRYLARLRELTKRCGALLIFDEVVTGYRLGLGGAQEAFGIRPDLTTFGKIIGGGLPIGAVGGPRRIMHRLAPEGDVYHGGTFAGHPLTMATGIAALTELTAHPPYERLDRLARRLREGLTARAAAAGIPVHINRAGSALTIFFSSAPVRNFADVKASHRERFARWARELRSAGILIPPSPYETWFLSAAHTDRDIDQCLTAARAAFRVVARP